MPRLVICAHGIGDHAKDFATAWEPVLHEAVPDIEFEVAGLHWDDLLDEARKKYLQTDPNLAKALQAFGITLPELLTGGPRDFLGESIGDVVTYCALAEMRQLIWAECTVRLAKMTNGRERDCVLLGHSLGAALMAHLAEAEWRHTTSLVYRGMLLAGHALGIVSPLSTLFPDPLLCTPKAAATRVGILRDISAHWRSGSAIRVAIIENTNDAICSDVMMNVGGAQLDPIPVRQGFNADEVKAIHTFNPGAVTRVTFGDAKPAALANNHEITNYIRQPAFAAALRRLLA